jgi:putative Ca2+/H+ antiporter (TMEM165/GDT1 family)
MIAARIAMPQTKVSAVGRHGSSPFIHNFSTGVSRLKRSQTLPYQSSRSTWSSIRQPAPAYYRAFSGDFMDLKVLLTVFFTIFLAELGDKTQLATLLYATDRNVSKLTVFLGASLALVAASAVGVLVGHLLSTQINTRYLHHLAGAGFIAIGIWTLMKA